MNLAPNGKPSKLTPEQYKIVRTPEFISWFGDWINSPETASKVVDEETKEPLVVWHGSKSSFNEFDLSKSLLFGEPTEEAGFHFGTLSQASSRIKSSKEKYFYECFLNIRNIVEVSDMVFFSKHKISLRLYELGVFTKEDYRNWGKFYDIIKEKKIDGLKYLNKWEGYGNEFSYNVFYPEQIKLADGTNITFDANNPDIRFSLGGATNDDKTFLNNPYKIYNDKEFVKQIEESIEKDGSSFVCTFVASAIKMLEGKKVKIYGFSQKENPQALYFKDEDEDEGHHFAVADDRYIIDAWIYNNFEDYSIGKKFNRSVFDLKNKNDKKIIKYLYGNRNNWTDITNRVEDFKKLFPKNKLKKPDVTYKDGGNTTQDYWAGKKSGEWYSKKLRIDQLRIGKEFLLARRNFKIQKSKVDEQQKPVWNWEHRDSVYDEKGMAIGYDWYNDITDDVLLLSDLYNEFIELREEKKKLVNSNKEELEKIGYKDWIYKDYLINKRVKWDMHDSEGVLEGLGSNESIIAIGTKSYCKEIQNNEAKEEYEYYINPSKTQKGLYVLREVWLGYYLKSGGNIDDFTYDIGGL